MGLCFTCEQPTQPQIEVNVPTEENNQNSYKLIITQRNRKRVQTNIEVMKNSRMRLFMKVPTIRPTANNLLVVSAEKLLAKTKTLNPNFALDMSQSIDIGSKNSKIYYPKKAKGEKKSITTIIVNKEDISQKEESKIEETAQADNDTFQQENVEVTDEQQKIVLDMLKQHYLFKHFDENMLKLIFDSSQGYQIEPGCVVFSEGEKGESFFIILNGKVEITAKESNERKIVGPGEGFGEMALIYKDYVRNSTAIAITKVDFYVIFGVSYRETSKNYSKHSIEQITYFMNGNLWLTNIDPIVKLNLASLAITEDYDKNEYIYSNKNESSLLEKIYLVKSGTLEVITDQHVKKLYPKNYFGERQVIMDINDSSTYDLVAAEASSAYVITKNMLIEAIGDNYKEVIMFSMFRAGVLKNSFFKNIFMEGYYKSLFDLFKLKHYKTNDVVYNQIDSNNKKAVLILEGALCDCVDNSIIASQGKLYGDEIINSNDNLENNIIAHDDRVLTLECPWTTIRNRLHDLSKNSSLDLFKRANKLSKMYLFKYLSESKILELCQLMNKVKFSEGDIIIKEKTKVKFLYVLAKGRVSITKGNYSREVNEGNFFGEVSLLNDEDGTSEEEIVALSEVQCYTLSKEKFMTFLFDENMNDYIKKKMCLEDTTIELKDLYHIAFLGRGRFGSVSLVHNGYSLYAIKTVPRNYIEGNCQMAKYLLQEKNVLLSLDFPLVVKLVKTLKTDSLCFFLMEYIEGKSLEEYINSKTIHKNLNEAKFFGACMSLILDYLKKKNITHRDIKPANLIIDNTGYIKILDFGTAKKIKDFTFTVIGTPTCMAPEVLLGKGYSFPVDYWSLGVCMYYIYYGYYPFGHKSSNVMTIYDQIINKELTFSREPGLLEFNHFIGTMLNKKPTNRLCTLQSIQSDRLYKGFKWNELMQFKLKPPYIPKQKVLKDIKSSLNNIRTPFLPLIQKYKFDSFAPAEQNDDYSTCRDYSNWFEEF